MSAWLEATQLAGVSEAEADKFFGKIDPSLIEGMTLKLRAPVEVRTDFTARHAELLDQI